MRGIPDHSNQQPALPSLSAALPATLTLKEKISDEWAGLGQEVVDMVLCRGLYSLESYRRAAKDLCNVLRVNGRRMKQRDLYYMALRVKWIKDSTDE